MTQLTLNITDPAVLPSLRELLGFVSGVSIAEKEEYFTEREAVLSAFQQVKRIQDGTIKTHSVNELLAEYGD